MSKYRREAFLVLIIDETGKNIFSCAKGTAPVTTVQAKKTHDDSSYLYGSIGFKIITFIP